MDYIAIIESKLGSESINSNFMVLKTGSYLFGVVSCFFVFCS